jgi:hypothetical protein
MADVAQITIRATFLSEPPTKIALNVAQTALATALGGIEGASLVHGITGGGQQLDLAFNAMSTDSLAELLEQAGPHLSLLSKSASLMYLEVSGPIPEEFKAALKPFSPIYHDRPAGA